MGDLQIGRIVELKSGGPKMTLQSVHADDTVCAWFSGEKLNEHDFPLIALVCTDVKSLSDEQLQDLIRDTGEFRAGQSVTLKSGGPRMIVKSINGADPLCMWFSGERLREKSFQPASLLPTDLEPLSVRQLQDLIDSANGTES